MRDLATNRENKCERVYTTPTRCVAAQTRLPWRVSTLHELTAN